MTRFESIRGLTEKSVYNIPLSTSIHLALRHHELVYVFGIIQLKLIFSLHPFILVYTIVLILNLMTGLRRQEE